MSTPPSPPFALVLPSRPVYAAPTALSETQYAFTFPQSPPFSHIVAFLLPGTILPADTLAGVYIQFPSSAPAFKFLGALGNDKQSVIFRVGVGEANAQPDAGGVDQDEMTDIDAPAASGLAAPTGEVIVGVSIEPAASIQTQLANLKSARSASSTALIPAKAQQPTALTTKLLAQRIIENAFNFLASFSGSTTGPGGEEMVPLRSFKAWWEKFERRVEMDPGFLEKQDDA
ncbi:MAG: hypothetical protein Q9191_003764 [Dirinaria sp. TL-2023a]